ncbi:biofilm peroxide resistance protein BsmA [Enterobacteriaceae bacterium H20N1]|uniref:Biofilm peroxide resistance protein BsmA n=1 Tax=Dryocola boscaweniae TaxID=2925397 RepID=A0A9X2W8L4_9ENTR|nr:biofilm peroxide resistance protein BsmA [Dryocola boscaweniae]MCT4703046.1 biofilm peroxide resistance protein BsmA [Dryocola boscaweniae]MCT4715181.1 biofilm peroxide resistance protein BsmA [Dryocola boscaweniae]MCT4720214.1 biofilm peroxide resistance protein BsmA [Dryocola boscaweniae]
MAIKKRENTMRLLSALLLATTLSACSVLQGTPQPAPPVTEHPQEIQRSQTQGLTKIGTVTALERGSPMDTEAVIKAKAAAAKADYYLIILNDETVMPGQWYAQAILYRK